MLNCIHQLGNLADMLNCSLTKFFHCCLGSSKYQKIPKKSFW